MANWTYNDWRGQATDALRLERLKLHVVEVSERIDAAVSSSGQSINSKELLTYLQHLEAQADKLQERVDASAGTRGGGFVTVRVR